METTPSPATTVTSHPNPCEHRPATNSSHLKERFADGFPSAFQTDDFVDFISVKQTRIYSSRSNKRPNQPQKIAQYTCEMYSNRIANLEGQCHDLSPDHPEEAGNSTLKHNRS